MKNKLIIIATALAALALATSCNLFFSPHAKQAKGHLVAISVSGARSGTGSSRGLIGDDSVASVEIAVKGLRRRIPLLGERERHERRRSRWDGGWSDPRRR